MTFATTKINDIVVKAVKLPDKPKPQDGIFNDSYQNVYICAKKKSGKSQLIYNITKRMLKKNLIVFIFCSTVNKDDTYKALTKMIEDKGNHLFVFNSLDDENGLTECLEVLESTEEITEAGEDEKRECEMLFRPKKKSKKQPPPPPPEYLLIFDDLSNQLRDSRIAHLLKRNRHLRATIILSSQYLHDLPPTATSNIDVWIIFPLMIKEKVLEIHKRADLAIEPERFYELYKQATNKQYNFLFIDSNREEYRHNLNERYDV